MTRGRILQKFSLKEGHATHAPLTKGIRWGFIGGLTGTMVMDGLLMAIFHAVKLPAFLCFSIVGDTVSQLFSKLNLQVASGVPTGITAHYLIGPLFGVLFGVIVEIIPSLRVVYLKKTLLVAIVYVEVLSQPILLTTPILLKLEVSETLQWYGGSFVMHLIMALVLGTVMWYELRPGSR